MNYILSGYPIFGSEIQCPQCHWTIPALFLTDAYFCPQHGAFEVNPIAGELIHVESGRCWRQWEGKWHHQHSHPDSLRFEIFEAIDYTDKDTELPKRSSPSGIKTCSATV